MKAIPPVQKYMTYVPKTIEASENISQARDVMRKLHLRHLPVLKNGKLVGILTDRDINLLLQLDMVDPKNATIEGAYTNEPYFTAPETPLNEVVAHMAEHKYGCALIMDRGNLIGIFTEIDAYRALAELLETRLKQ